MGHSALLPFILPSHSLLILLSYTLLSSIPLCLINTSTYPSFPPFIPNSYVNLSSLLLSYLPNPPLSFLTTPSPPFPRSLILPSPTLSCHTPFSCLSPTPSYPTCSTHAVHTSPTPLKEKKKHNQQMASNNNNKKKE